MNEIEIIRSQLALERSHATEVANACAAALGDGKAAAGSGDAAGGFRDACVSYLVWVLARFEERDQTLSELLAARRLGALAGHSGTSREALARLEAALAAGDAEAARTGWQEFARYFNSAWTARHQALEAALAEHASVGQWRAVCAIDADSMLEERNRYGQVAAHLPAGVELRRAPPAG
jgi:hypothetical protein